MSTNFDRACQSPGQGTVKERQVSFLQVTLRHLNSKILAQKNPQSEHVIWVDLGPPSACKERAGSNLKTSTVNFKLRSITAQPNCWRCTSAAQTTCYFVGQLVTNYVSYWGWWKAYVSNVIVWWNSSMRRNGLHRTWKGSFEVLSKLCVSASFPQYIMCLDCSKACQPRGFKDWVAYFIFFTQLANMINVDVEVMTPALVSQMLSFVDSVAALRHKTATQPLCSALSFVLNQ